ncbi:sigma-54 interaction domain-containing protein [Candidatus Nitrospira salsa]
MAGSFLQIQPDDDCILFSRLEGLTLLANHLPKPVVIFDPTLKLVYANAQAQTLASSCPLLSNLSTPECDSVSNSKDSCTTCAAKELFLYEELQSATDGETAIIGQSDPSCPFPNSFSVPGDEGNTACVVMMGKCPEESTVWKTRLEGLSALNVSSIPDKQLSHSLIGRSASMQRLVEMIGLISTSESTVLIEGESGTGKELVAKTIHELSPRCNSPFVVVECSSLPESLLESELFGHVKGAFTGAIVDRKGLFEEAEGGTIFLDEIADTIPTFQAKLLRVLQEGEIKPVGGNRPIKVNVRVISACNKPLTRLVEEKTFRSDLYYRLAVLPLLVPALRDRREDIPLLVHHFLGRSCVKNRKTGLSISSTTMKALVSHEWAGNVRELENVIERAVVITQGSELTIQDILGTPQCVDESSDLPSISKAARKAVEKQEILRALQETQGDKTRAARKLNISRANLYNKLKAYQIQ